MNTSIARNKILERIANSLNQKNKAPYPLEQNVEPTYTDNREPLISKFTHAFEKVEGSVVLCGSPDDLLKKLRALVQARGFTNVICRTPSLVSTLALDQVSIVNKDPEVDGDAAMTDCEFLVARTGAIVLSSGQRSGRVLPVHTPVHIVVAYQRQVVSDTSVAIDRMKGKYGQRLPSAIFFASGPSRTGDIERTLVVGVHGPKEVYVFLVNDGSGEASAD